MRKVIDVVERFKRMDGLIKDGRTGNANKFAKELGISRSHLFNHIEELKDLGIEVSYNRDNGSYEYSGEMEPEIQNPLRVIKRKKQLVNVNGGCFSQESKFTGLFRANFELK
ncbi:hypothetical protein QUH73_14095 [Labilibaculum sp. K2S]|uniref:hypothetical protein n=1 Tax=Labilibaculum sp. K2S TaxID=3056386 RepID=UPI0025A35D87|nr:hypothetical protein [Labilibaculum sp. K2S]MDM8160952.1 hypothetical protein [Labilibaculum sp. K2S]